MTIRSAAQRRQSGEAGFTLTEVMVAIMIIGILAAVGIPTFLGARARAHDKAAQATVQNALLSAETLAAQSGDFTTADHTALQAGVQSPTYLAHNADSTAPDGVSVYGHSAGWAAAAYSQSGTCFMLRQHPNGLTEYAVISGSTGCNAFASWTASTGSSW